MRLLHTSDWHVGKTIRGHPRLDEHRQVLAEIVAIAAERHVDLVVVAGDLFESAAPTPEAEAVVYEALLGLASTGAEVAVIAGNHDNGRRLAAVAPLLELGRVHLVSEPVRPDQGGVRTLVAGDGVETRLALLPFVSKRGIVRAEALVGDDAFEHVQAFADRLRRLVDVLATSFSPDTVNVLVAHAYVAGGATGGGERAAHVLDDYAVPAQILPASAQYVALGHLHRAQAVSGPTAARYCGSPLQLDFGETDQVKQVNVVDLEPGLPARVDAVTLTAGRPLRTVAGTLAELAVRAGELGDSDAWVRAVVREPRRAGLADEVRQLFGERVVDVLVDAPAPVDGGTRRSRRGRSPVELFDQYCAEQSMQDPRVRTLFIDLLDAALDPGEAPAGPAGRGTSV